MNGQNYLANMRERAGHGIRRIVFSETVGSCGVFTYIYPNPETLAYKKPVFLQGILGVVHPNV